MQKDFINDIQKDIFENIENVSEIKICTSINDIELIFGKPTIKDFINVKNIT